MLNEIRNSQGDLPTVPIGPSFKPSPGARLRFRLIPRRGSGAGLLPIGILCVTFLVITTTLIILVIDSTIRGGIDWVGLVLSIALACATVWLIFQFVRKLLMRTGVGPTDLEISDLPLVAGTPYQLFLSQPTRLRLKMLEITLECEEQTTFRQGTDIRTEKQIVYSKRLFRKRGIVAASGQPFQSAIQLTVPPNAMHSFRAKNNSIVWRLVVRSEIKKWPTIERRFPLVVLPTATREVA